MNPPPAIAVGDGSTPSSIEKPRIVAHELESILGPVGAGTHELHSLRRNFTWTIAGNGVYAACQWGILVLLAKLGAPEVVGQFSLGLALTAPIFMLTNLQLRAIQATETRGGFHFGDYLVLRLIMTALACVAIAGLVLGAGYRPETAMVILAVGLAKGIESVSDVFYGLLQKHERMDRIAVSMMIKGGVSLLVFGALMATAVGLLWATLGLAATWAVVLVVYDIPRGAELMPVSRLEGRTTWPNWPRYRVFSLTRLALPLGIVMLLNSLSTNIPRYYIESWLGDRELGIFAAMAYLMVMGNTIVSALGQSASPRLARYYAAGRVEEFRNLLLKLVGLGAIGGGVAIAVVLIFGRVLLQTLYTPEYAQRVDVFCWLTVAAALGAVASFLGFGMTAARCFKIQAPLCGIVVLTATLACSWAVPRHGLLGAAYAAIAAMIVQLVGSVVVVESVTRMRETVR